MKYKKQFLLLVILTITSFSVSAKAISYYCSYPPYSDEDGRGAEDFNLEFKYDTITHDAFMVGNNGISKVAAIKESQGITFLELLSTGAVQTTTIANNYKSVHSRHTLFLDNLMPSQYYGTCTNTKL